MITAYIFLFYLRLSVSPVQAAFERHLKTSLFRAATLGYYHGKQGLSNGFLIDF